MSYVLSIFILKRIFVASGSLFFSGFFKLIRMIWNYLIVWARVKG